MPTSRRDLLRQVGTSSAGNLAGPFAGLFAGPLAASPARRSARAARRAGPDARAWRDAMADADVPAAPPIEVIAANRMGFGPRPGDLDAFRALGATPQARLDAYVDQQLHPADIADNVLDQRMAAANFETLGKPLDRLFADHFMYEGDDYMVHIKPAWETAKATFLRAVYSRRQLFEVLAHFWHNHFNVYAWDYWTSSVYVHYDRDVIRRHALGNFRQLLEAVATSTAMLYYLDNANNSRSGPNENWARELFELHTLGAAHYYGVRRQQDVPGYREGAPAGYVDDDIYEATRCFTGWRVDFTYGEPGVGRTGKFLYYEPWHDRFQKRVLGRDLPSDQAPMKDGHDVLDMLAAHPGTARHVAGKLCRRLVSDEPPAALVEEAAAVFAANREAPDQIARVVGTILRSEAFRTTWGRKIKRPFEAVAGALRATEADFMPDDGFLWFFGQTGHFPFDWPAPNGYPDDKQDWTSTMSILQRWRVVNGLMEGWNERVKFDVAGQTPPDLRTPGALADFWIARILGRPMSAAARAEVVGFMAQGRNPSFELSREQIAERLSPMVQLILAAPDFQWL